ncbi:hypothetical protein QR721_08870 [Aciduricibacillus chroicocephali]|uniref:Uncharacterized protein n=1 Tax=Aciduricibacillus chroicocephali TaxID=3054939 RepID=A0ABY9KSF1_9BACI|nr:hypothetical protein QR721_08870 [Bacillaceae bacterium 44XB]
MLGEVKNYRLASGKTIRERLESEYSEGTWQCNGNEVKFVYWVSGLKRIFKWKVEEGKPISLSASASRLTPELNAQQLTYIQKRKNIDKTDLAVHDYFNKLFAQDYCDEECAKLTGEKFGLDLDTVHKTVIDVSESVHL